ncbi:helix-turn-helix transcriptional regulator [Tolypothrix sp. LEGE 11397]|nr:MULTISPECIES: helix-turn-helix transcriptional regulator [unclassified Tolypothrix]MBE9083520.1 helix-turn-helix transcriptional regulator [Tolypothrix sp. LEGE 11397]UYD30899.1 helix-turn-helix transcriptional regulator [Tolypothrix sp. PCC 7712]UYD38621.1 helix-turn-helix transcriptional regulator [Tolypothrix sp. PCC 7601]UYD38627.1 helix-turn-helix transcriptional regulator [Tolypothrix sp. PCC 7601]
MIKNEQQYQNSLDWLQRFEQSIAQLDNNEQLKAELERWKLHRDSYQSQVDELKLEISEYERLINCDISKPLKIKVDSLNKLPNALIKARIAAQISQQELADILGIDEQRVKEYEDTDYQCASFVEILEVSTALGVEFETATVQVDFSEIEAVKESVDKWQKEKMNIKTKAS